MSSIQSHHKCNQRTLYEVVTIVTNLHRSYPSSLARGQLSDYSTSDGHWYGSANALYISLLCRTSYVQPSTEHSFCCYSSCHSSTLTEISKCSASGTWDATDRIHGQRHACWCGKIHIFWHSIIDGFSHVSSLPTCCCSVLRWLAMRLVNAEKWTTMSCEPLSNKRVAKTCVCKCSGGSWQNPADQSISSECGPSGE